MDMRSEVLTVNREHSSPAGGRLRYVTRQAILDVRGKIHGYDLLFRREV